MSNNVWALTAEMEKHDMRGCPQTRLVATFGLLTVVVVVLVAVCHYVLPVNHFYLANLDTGLIYAPYCQNGARFFVIPAGSYKVIRPSSREKKISRILADNKFASLAFTNATVEKIIAYLNENVGHSNGIHFINRIDDRKLGPPGLGLLSADIPGPVAFSMPSIHHLSFSKLLHILACNLWVKTSIRGNSVEITNATTLFAANSERYAGMITFDKYHQKATTEMDSHFVTNSMYDALFGF